MKTLKAVIEFPVSDDCDMATALLRLSIQLRELSRTSKPDKFVQGATSPAKWRLDAKFEG